MPLLHTFLNHLAARRCSWGKLRSNYLIASLSRGKGVPVPDQEFAFVQSMPEPEPVTHPILLVCCVFSSSFRKTNSALKLRTARHRTAVLPTASARRRALRAPRFRGSGPLPRPLPRGELRSQSKATERAPEYIPSHRAPRSAARI
uniref:Uncharacterized protein n=1 Tax=Aegilops tauschii subsp. strangulata TaxID=200361 RepID=A0A453ND62_AEGTS